MKSIYYAILEQGNLNITESQEGLPISELFHTQQAARIAFEGFSVEDGDKIVKLRISIIK